MNDIKNHKGDGHRGRLRDKFLLSGLSGFHDYEIIELLLSLATPRKDCKQPAKEALRTFKTIQGVLEASKKELCDISGIGPVNCFGLKLIKAVSDRYLKNKALASLPLTNSSELINFLKMNIRDRETECFCAVFLNAKNRVLGIETLFTGTLTSSSVYPREVVKEALMYKAAALIFAHNHPSGSKEPSPEDFSITKKLVYACMVMGITVHEHIVMGRNNHYSFADHGVITEYVGAYEKERLFV